MKTYKIELRHAPSKNRLNDFRDNRLPPLTVRLAADDEAIDLARQEVADMARRSRNESHRYIEASLFELLPIGPASRDDDNRRLGRWVANDQGLVWRPRPD